MATWFRRSSNEESYRDFGRGRGRLLSRHKAGIDVVTTRVERSHAAHLAQLREKLAVAVGAFEVSQQRGANHARSQLRYAQRQAVPFEHRDPLRGIAYTLLSFLLLAADFFILGASLAKALDLDWEGLFPSNGQPREPVTGFLDVVVSCAAILLLGFFIKTWRDVVLRHAADGKREATTRRVDWWIAWLALGFAVLTIVSAALIRMVSSGAQEAGAIEHTASFRAFVFVIGLALPLISIAFFIFGYDQLVAAVRQLSCWFLDRWHAYWIMQHQRTALAHDSRRAVLEQQIATRSLDADVQARVRAAVAEYDDGYRDGVVEILNAGLAGGTYRRLRPLLISIRLREGA